MDQHLATVWEAISDALPEQIALRAGRRRAALAALPGGAAPEVLSMTCHYLRAAGGPGSAVRVAGRAVRLGRTSAVVEGTVQAPDGRPAMLLQFTARLGS